LNSNNFNVYYVQGATEIKEKLVGCGEQDTD